MASVRQNRFGKLLGSKAFVGPMIGKIGDSESYLAEQLTVKATFTGMPHNNADFGRKTAKLLWRGNPCAENAYEVFFDKSATNHPDGQAGSPNWFYYWGQALSVVGVRYSSSQQDLYGECPGMLNWSYHVQSEKGIVIIYDLAADVDDGDINAAHGARRTTGIDTFHDTYLHEKHHEVQVTRADNIVGIVPFTPWRFGWSWNQSNNNHWTLGSDGRPGVAGVDDDANGAIDDLFDWGPGELGRGDDNSLDFGYDWPRAFGPMPPPPWAGGLPIEAPAYNQEHDDENEYAESDWGNPGKQHRTINKYDD